MRNITLAMKEETLRTVRRIAAEKETTVNGLVREYLEHLAGEKKKKANLQKRLKQIFAKADAAVGPITWTRDEVHER
ncbi:MAG: hypothetical protein M3Y82_08805 [Verrucomicrobiota bacterium]|nr:hypothetical protein [Verrucomicrobiota bacterium]